jgi:hypothetical protein
MKKAGVLFSILVVLAGIAAIVSVTAANRRAARANDWMQTRASVERVEGTRVTYRYDAAGSTHRVSSEGRPQVRYSAGAPILAYVNPQNPAEAVLDLPPRPESWPVVAGGLAMFLGGVMTFWFARGSATVAAKKRVEAAARRTPARPMERLQAPPPVKWNRGEDTTRTRPPRPPGDDTTRTRGPRS